MTISIREQVPLRDVTTFKAGGNARYFVSVSTLSELSEAVSFADDKKLPLVILGGGSNVLVADGLLEAVVAKIEIRGLTWNSSDYNSQTVVVGAGEKWDALVAETVRRGLWGIENLSGIPGCVGGAPVQNIGAYGAELANVLEWVEVFDSAEKKVKKLSASACEFAYRDSIFKRREGKSFVITRVALRLSESGTPNLHYKDLAESFKLEALHSNGELEQILKHITLQDIRRTVLEIRAKKFPDLRKFGTAGSFFKNPVVSVACYRALKKKYPDLPAFAAHGNGQETMIKLSLAWILDHVCGLRGFRAGAVGLFERQPMVIVNYGEASADAIKRFAADVAAVVYEKTGIKIENEVRYI